MYVVTISFHTEKVLCYLPPVLVCGRPIQRSIGCYTVQSWDVHNIRQAKLYESAEYNFLSRTSRPGTGILKEKFAKLVLL